MNVIKHDGFAVRIPASPSRYRANCSRDFGCFVHGETKGMNILDATNAGLTKGKFVDLALCWVENRNLTFQPNYINEPFTEIWGIPTGGEMQTQFGEKCSELSTFLIHRQSKDKLDGLVETASRQAFVEWVNEGMEGDPNDYALLKMKNFYLSGIFRFEFAQTEGQYGTYYIVKATKKDAATPLELAAIKAANDIYQMQLDGLGVCTDLRLIDNEIQSSGQLESINQVAIEPAKNGKRPKAIAGK